MYFQHVIGFVQTGFKSRAVLLCGLEYSQATSDWVKGLCDIELLQQQSRQEQLGNLVVGPFELVVVRFLDF